MIKVSWGTMGVVAEDATKVTQNGRWMAYFSERKDAEDYAKKLRQLEELDRLERLEAASAAEQVSDEAILAGELDRPGRPPTAPPVPQEELVRAGHFDRPGS